MKKVIRFLRDKYTDRLNIAIITLLLCLGIFPILTGWLVVNMGKLLSAIYLVVLLILFSIHGLFILCTLLPLWRDKLDACLKEERRGV